MGQMMMQFIILPSIEIWWNKESNETRIEWFGLKIRDKSLFQNQQNSPSNLGKMKNKTIVKTKLTYQIKSKL